MQITIFHMQPKNIGQHVIRNLLIQDLETLGYKVVDLKVKGYVYDNDKEFADNIDIALKKASEDKRISFKAINPHNKLELLFRINWDDAEWGNLVFGRPYIYIRSFQEFLVYDGEPSLGYTPNYYFDTLIKLGRLIYTQTLPVFSWIDFMLPEFAPTGENIDSLNLSRLYWANFFSPEYLIKIGRERFGTLPIGYIESLADNGILYILDRNLFGDNTSFTIRNDMLHHLHLL